MSKMFSEPLKELAEFDELDTDLNRGKGPIQVSGCIDSQKVHLMYAAGEDLDWKLIVTFDDSHAREIYEDFLCFTDQVWLYPAKDLLFYNSDIHSNLLTRERMQVIRHLIEDEKGVVITTIDGLMDHLIPIHMLEDKILYIGQDDIIDIENLKSDLVMMGYERMDEVDGAGQFSIRGGIIDIFPLTDEVPVRIELWDDTVDSIRTFDPESQRSVEQLDEAVIYPASELVFTDEQLRAGVEKLKASRDRYVRKLQKQLKTQEAYRIDLAVNELAESIEGGWGLGGLDSYLSYFCDDTVSFIKYFPADKTAIFLDEPARLKEKGDTVELEFRESMANRLESGYLLPEQTSLLFSIKETLARLETPHTVYMTGLENKVTGMSVNNRYSIVARNVNSYQNSFDFLIKDLKQWKKDKYRVILLSISHTRASRLAGDLREYGLSAFCPDDEDRLVKPGEILVTHGNLHRGFVYPQIRFVVITEGDMFGTAQKKRRRKKTDYEGKVIQSFNELSVGDYVVHEEHGLGIYRGIEKIEQDKVVRDYMKIEYADGGNLYLPATRLESVQKYAGGGARAPKLNKLGGEQWKKTKARVKTAVNEVAKDLVRLYAIRQESEGFRFSEDTEWQKEFEELFPYEETQDQLDAINDVKADMESNKIMDRLICGDVGFGKTEIALRAAFKAVQDGKQVVYLVPTTILAQQHYNTFVQRMKDFPVRVDLLSRFRTSAEIKKTLNDLQKGLVDIVIGTHRVLSDDVHFRNLGLLVIDEEQRFGVAHKEKIKKLRENVDVLTLTATPIPRTLHMSLVGIRDMSVLEEPPVDRVPIQTYVMEYNDEMVREAINRELARNGQVYYVYNRVQDIADVAAHVQNLVPNATVVYAHGQMHERSLEQIMLDFVNGEIDVLVCTTIIETGLDIPNVNTMIVQDADRMGLAQLYQLRGRVGRSNRTAYAFLMYKRDKILKEEAEKRLKAIREFTELGSGIRIAMRDLEIRGAGNVLGAEQHGHMEAVGYDLYCKLLNEAVLALRGERTEDEDFETVVECDMDAYIPSSYIKNESQKLDVYKRISVIENEEEYMDMQDELIDRFGEIPQPVNNLLRAALLKADAHKAYVTEIDITPGQIKIFMYPKAKLRTEGIPELISQFKGKIRMITGQAPELIYTEKNADIDCMKMVGTAEQIIEKLLNLCL